MPYGYLLAVALIALCTALALAPVRRARILPAVRFRLTLLINEQPFLAFVPLAASSLLAFGQGDIDTAGGRAVFGAAALTSLGLVVIAWRGRQARDVLDRALREALGDRYAESRGRPAARRRRSRPSVRTVVAPLLVRRLDVERLANISYGDAGKRNMLDVYRHRSRPTGNPVLVYVHGGGYFSGRKSREARALLYRLASLGWVCISANYRLRPAATFPDHLVDLKKAIAWVRSHGVEYGADPSRVVVAGSSAGGHLAALAALTQGYPVFQPGFEDADTSVSAAVVLYGWLRGYYGDPAIASSPADYVRPDAPPFFVAHGDHDTLAPVQDARRFVERLRLASTAPVVYSELPGAQHAFDVFHSIRFDAVVDAVVTFAEWAVRYDASRRSGRGG
ncbi:MAG TPA: alpha/beta hydrolase fold domain-containing protein [Jiangellaceae bacterium]